MVTRRGGFLDQIDKFDAEFFGINPREAAHADPQQRLLLEVAYQAVEDAGLTLPDLSGRRVGVYVGISTWDYSFLQVKSEERASIGPYTNVGTALCIAANRISYFFNLIGPSLAVDTACSSSLVATHLACRGLWNGESELAFVGGVNVLVQPEVTIGFSKASMLSPDGRCKSFDARANGYVRGEGAGVVILKPLARALAAGDPIYAVIRATAVNQDGRTAGISLPNQVSQEANIVDALRLADISPETVQYVEAHGTGTPVGDPIEAAAIGAIYGKARKNGDYCVIGSIKSNVGHLEAAAGIAGLIKTALCLRHRRVPANVNFEKPNPQIPFDDLRLRVAQQLATWPETYGQPPRAGVNGFGFGGTNGHVILEAPPELDQTVRTESAEGRACVLPLSARSEAALPDLARSYLDALRTDGGLKREALRDICFSAGMKRSHHDFRLALAAHDHAELVDQLEGYLQGEQRANCSSGRTSNMPLQPVFVCSGMGQQWWAMGRELLSAEPVFRRAVEEVSDLFASHAGWSLLEKLTADEQNSQLQGTQFGQPAIFALQVGLAALWRSWGIEPAAVLGHSAGEMSAAYIAGALSLEDAVRVAVHRSRLQHRMAGQGSMLAVGMSGEEAARLVERHPRAISIAATNGARSVTLSGDAAVLAEIDKALTAEDVFSRFLQVDVPYHSPKMESLEKELLECLHVIRPRSASTPFFSTVTGTALVGTELDASYWYRNVREPVHFSDTLGSVIESGHRVFLELGAHPILRRDIAACLSAKAAQGLTLGSLRRGDRERAALLGSLGQLYTAGAEIDWRKLYPAGATAIKLPVYPFQSESFWHESEHNRRVRMSRPTHPLLGIPLEAPKPSWEADLGSVDLGYLMDHRIGDSIVFPGAGYVEMALAAAAEIFGPGPCIVEDIEFQKFLLLDQVVSPIVRLELDPASNEFTVYSSNSSDDSWDTHAHGRVRQFIESKDGEVDLAQVRSRCPASFDREETYRRFATSGYRYGSTFQGMERLWLGEREMLAEVHVPTGLKQHYSEYRLQPAVLDACLQTMLAVFSPWSDRDLKGEIFVPVKINRIRFRSPPSTRMFAYTRVTALGPTEMKVDLKIVDESGRSFVELQGITVRQGGHRPQRLDNTLYEYRWKLDPLKAASAGRDSNHVPSPQAPGSVMQAEGASLHQRFNRARFQDEYQSRSRDAASAYIARALRELGWTQADGTLPIETLAGRLGIVPQYHRWLGLMLKELAPQDFASAQDARQLWKALWDEFPECQAELRHLRLCGDNLPAVLRGEVDPLNLIFPEGALTSAEALYQDSPTFRIHNLLVQKAVGEIVRRLPKGKALRILEIGGGTGGTTSFVLPVLPHHCTEYVFTDVSARFTAHAQYKFSQFPFVQCRTLDIESDPVEQGFDPNSFDLIIASDVLHATKDLRKTLHQIKALLGSGGMVSIVELTRPWLGLTLVFGLLKGWWLFDDDVRQDEPCISQAMWKNVLQDAGFTDTVCVADCPEPDSAQHSVIVARGPQLALSPALSPKELGESRTWVLFSDRGTAGCPSIGAELGARLRAREDAVIEVTQGTEFRRLDPSKYSIRAGEPDDVKLVMASVCRQAPRLAGIVHLCSLDAEATEAMTSKALPSSVNLGSVGALQLIQAVAATDGLAVDGVWLVTRSAQAIGDGDAAIQVAQSPLWGLGRVAVNEYQNLNCRLVDLATGSREEIESLVRELDAPAESEDEIALVGEMRYVHRLLPVSVGTVNGAGPAAVGDREAFHIEVSRPGMLDSLSARRIERAAPKSNEVEIEVAAAGLNFMDLMLVMGMLPPEATADASTRNLPGLECAGLVVAVGDAVSDFAVGDEVVAIKRGSLATHVIVDARFVAHKPRNLTFEQAATIPIAVLTAYYSLHTMGQLQPGERVLIHSGTGGVGMAAVQLALKAGAVVFATAGTPEKRDLLTALGVSHVMDSRSLAFADEVLDMTGGEGVDIVLNSLSGDAIDKSLSILRPLGRFIEIGKTDIYKNRKIGMRPLRENISMFVVDLLSVGEARPERARAFMRDVLSRFEDKELQPLPHRAFPAARVAEAFREMAQAKHIGKLIVSIRDREGLRVERDPRQSVAIDANASYLLTGGLGGFGLAVAQHLARSGARHLALVGRSAPSPSALEVVDGLRRSGVEVMVFAADVTNLEQVRNVIDTTHRSMGPLRGIVHAAMGLDDAPIERLTEARMWKAMAPKIMGAWHLHELTAGMPLDFFVMFSSFAAIVGNAGQANYVAGNAFLGALAQYRRACGLPALTIDWGVIGEVGHVAESREMTDRLERMGLKAMPLSETIEALDKLMSSAAVETGVAEVDWKNLFRTTGMRTSARYSAFAGDTGLDESRVSLSAGVHDILEADADAVSSLVEVYIRDHLARAMGSVPSRIDTQKSLPNLGIDSLIAVEVRNRINTDLGVNVPLVKLMQNESIRTLAAFVAERLLEPHVGERPKSAAKVADVPLGGADTANLLDRIDELTDEEVEHHLKLLERKGRF
jgi:acyl transferase domain-containing protein/acyl carrier protein